MLFNKITPRRCAAALTLLALLPASCTTGPDYKRPDVKTPEAYKSAAPEATAQTGPGREWWLLFNDAELTALIDEALRSNLDLKAAMARVAQSRASARYVKGSFYPVVTLDPSATRTHVPETKVDESVSVEQQVSQATSAINQITGLIGELSSLAQGNGTTTGGGSQGGSGTSGTGTGGATISATTSNRFQIPFDLSYEIDLWGRIRRSYESARAQAQASVYDLEVVRQTLLADLARNYFNLRSFDAQYEILTRNLALYQEQVDLTQNQYKAGLTGEADLLQAQVTLESTRAQAADTQRQRTDLEHAIAILLGRAPAEFSLPVRPLAGTLPVVPAGLPSDLLRQRPDVAESEQNLAAACAEIGVAQADFYPSVKLTGSAGFQSSDIQDVLDWGGATASFGPSLSLPIFKGGQLKANLEKARARHEELDAVYRSRVLSAFVDVEDALTDLHWRADAADAQGKAVDAAREYLRLVQIQYESGVTDYLHVVIAEKTLLNNELTEAQILNQRMVSSVLLIKAIGGGWDAETPVPQETAPAAAPLP